MSARDIAHRYARKAHMCAYNKHSDKHQEHSEFCDALCKDITTYGVDRAVLCIAGQLPETVAP